MTGQTALGGLLDRARGAVSSVRPALEPRFAPRYVEPEESDNADTSTRVRANVEMSTALREHELSLPASPAEIRGPVPMPMPNPVPMPDHIHADEPPFAGSSDVRSVHVSAPVETRHQATLSVPLRPAAVSMPVERDVARHETVSLRTTPIEPAFVRSQPVPASEAHALPGRDTGRRLPEAVLQQSDRNVQQAMSRQTAPLPVAAPAYEAQPSSPGVPSLPPPSPRFVQSASTAPPRVQVSIGRVEVRAAPVRAAPAAAPPAASAALSLHAYLQRSRGGHS
ncbi:hypothetical protein M3I54_00200 [Paraburkholderia sp. CNPSo 3274]|uniref:hypothetical protein n=1 Tax=Paraburkholderia sp. CNPSo 3274 TaxID=2940932 RepID=UPI0020B8E702|nr:hypothetical protein [Paraburkholderia sp. CNPSo 3274]MCP3705426.1 hypothetical protein [Paraburkholderia sp. CNPSo 3274]